MLVRVQAPSRKYLAPSLSDGATRQDKMSAVMGVKKRRSHTSNYMLSFTLLDHTLKLVTTRYVTNRSWEFHQIYRFGEV